MNLLLEKIKEKYEKELTDYKYIEDTDSFDSILSPGYLIIFISKKNCKKKKGYYQKCIQNCVMHLTLQNKKKYYIYTSEYFFFYQIKKNKLKDILKELVRTNFRPLHTIQES